MLETEHLKYLGTIVKDKRKIIEEIANQTGSIKPIQGVI